MRVSKGNFAISFHLSNITNCQTRAYFMSFKFLIGF